MLDNETLVQRLATFYNSRGIARKLASSTDPNNAPSISFAAANPTNFPEFVDSASDSGSDSSENDEVRDFSDNFPDFFYSFHTPSPSHFDSLDDRYFSYERLDPAPEGTGDSEHTDSQGLLSNSGHNTETQPNADGSAPGPGPGSNGSIEYIHTVDHTPGLPDLLSDEETHLLRVSPATKFPDAINLQWKGTVHMQDITSVKYKNNLATVVRGENGIDHLMVCCRSQVMVFTFDERNCPNPAPDFIVETKPVATSLDDRAASTWPYFPHTINTISCHKDWISGSALVTCGDDGKVHIWHVQNLLDSMHTSKAKPGALSGVRISPDISLNLDSSVWGLDVKTAVDVHGKKHCILAASANNRTVMLFYHHEKSQQFSTVETHPLLHNIPEVSLLRYTVDGEIHRAHLSCGTIAGELLVFRFQFKVYAKSADSEQRVEFDAPTIVHRTRLESDFWTSKPLHSRYFKNVASLKAMTGNPTLSESRVNETISHESRILCPEIEPSAVEDFGIARHWQHFESPVQILSAPEPQENKSATLYTWQEGCSRMTLVIKSKLDSQTNPDHDTLKDVFLAVSTDKKLGLFRGDTLFCTASTRPPFALDLPKNEETTWCNRISITLVVPELSIFVAATQIGLVTIMRLCEHRGAYGMRQEHIFPNAPKLVGDNFRTVAGMCVRNLSPSESQPRFFLYVAYSDGLTLTYQLSNSG